MPTDTSSQSSSPACSFCIISEFHSSTLKRVQHKKTKAFTLAEVLITLSIIGIVAALTLPSVYSNIQNYVFKSRWKKAYAEINQSYLMIKSVEDLSDYYECSELLCFEPLIQKIVKNYIYNKKIAGSPNAVEFESKFEYKNVLGEKLTLYPMFHYAYDANDMTIFYWAYYPHGGAIWIDVNGYKHKPNILGKDMFAIDFVKDKVYPFGQFMTSDWCIGKGTKLNVINIQQGFANTLAGIGCSYTYLYGENKN